MTLQWPQLFLSLCRFFHFFLSPCNLIHADKSKNTLELEDCKAKLREWVLDISLFRLAQLGVVAGWIGRSLLRVVQFWKTANPRVASFTLMLWMAHPLPCQHQNFKCFCVSFVTSLLWIFVLFYKLVSSICVILLVWFFSLHII